MPFFAPAAKRSARSHFLLPMCVVVFFLLLLCVTLSVFLLRAATDNALQYSESFGTQVESSLDNLCLLCNATFKQLQYDDSCQKIMSAKDFSEITPKLQDQYSKFLSTISISFSSVDDLSIYSQLLYSSHIHLRDDLTALCRSIDGSRGIVPLGLRPSSKDSAPHYLVFGCNYYGSEWLGSVFISLDMSSAQRFPVVAQKGFYPVLVGDNGEICFLGVAKAAEAADPNYAKIRGMLEETSLAQLQSNREFLLQVKPLEYAGCTFVGVTEKASIVYSLRPLYFLCILAVLFLVLSFLIWLWVLQKKILQPLDHLERKIQQAKSTDILGTPFEPFPELNACREIDIISSSFSDLLLHVVELSRHITESRENLHRSELLKKNAELKSLQSQINPHFLFNTLELVRADALKGNIQELSAIIAAMGRIYRYAAESSSLVCLADELSVVRSYIEIQQYRYQNGISAVYDISPQAEHAIIPKMLLQPLVENSFVHGLEFFDHSGIIFISAGLAGSMLTVVIRDNGMGISAENLAQIRAQMEAAEEYASGRSGIGIPNVYKRLVLQYGKGQFTFLIESTPGDGTCITVRIPCRSN